MSSSPIYIQLNINMRQNQNWAIERYQHAFPLHRCKTLERILYNESDGSHGNTVDLWGSANEQLVSYQLSY